MPLNSQVLHVLKILPVQQCAMAHQLEITDRIYSSKLKWGYKHIHMNICTHMNICIYVCM